MKCCKATGVMNPKQDTRQINPIYCVNCGTPFKQRRRNK